MTDTSTTDTGGGLFTGSDIASLSKQAMSSPDTSDLESLVSKVKKLDKAKEADPAIAAARDDATSTMKKDRAQVDDLYGKIEPFKPLPPPQQRQTDPIQAFGSFGSMFAILASGFTHQPAINAMNAAASAINAVKTNDSEAYKSAYDAWKDNTQMALDRHKLQHEDYQDALEKWKTDPEMGNAMMKAAAAKYDDQVTAALREAGLDEKLAQIHDSRQKSAQGMLENMPAIEEGHAKVQAYMEYQDAIKSGDPVKIAAAKDKAKTLAEVMNGRTMDPTAVKWQVLTDPEHVDKDGKSVPAKQFRYNPETAQATTLDGETYTPSAATKLGGGAGGGFGGGMKARYDQNMVRSGSEVNRTLQMLDQFPSGTSGGVFGGHGESINSWFRGKMRDEDQTDFNSSFAGADQEMGNLLRNGLGVSDSTANEMVAGFKPVASDTNFNRVYKLANMAAKAKTAIQSTFPVDDEAKRSRDQLIQKLDSFPTPEEVRAARESGKEINASTFGDALRQIKAAGSPKPHTGDVSPPAPQGVDPELWKHMTPEEQKLWQTK